MHEWSWMPRATCSHLLDGLLFEYLYNAQMLWHRGFGLCVKNDYSLLFVCFVHESSWMPRATCSLLIGDLLFKYPYNARTYGKDGYDYV